MPPAKKPVKMQRLGAIDLFAESIQGALDFRVMVAPIMAFVLQLITVVAALVAASPFIFFGLSAIAVDILVATVLLLIGSVLFIIVLFVGTSILDGFYVKSVAEYLERKTMSIEENLRFAAKHWKKFTAAYLLYTMVVVLIAAITIMPGLVLSIGQLISLNPEYIAALAESSSLLILQALMPIIGLIAAGVIAFALVNFLLSPLLFLWFPAAVLEEKPLFDCIGKGYDIGKSKYLRNLAALFLMSAVSTCITVLQLVDPTVVIGIILSIWAGLAFNIMAIKVYAEG
ncbi:MAG: hypothetical protein JW744_05345 [Candidatus Diapherotrites archaeon]|uniref:Uncharacterized protein n=1 Tax=Candidatus Iainarchaeum sp. TaxID=3101447 RepID=A0A938YUP2_9ARCH|nr:hypothetical protein [Candidatus Diapherotrites archaeon]